MAKAKKTIDDHREMIDKTIEAILCGAERNNVGLALFIMAHNVISVVEPEADKETQYCLAVELVSTTLGDVEIMQSPDALATNNHVFQ